jgi:hypothetical protein
MTASAMLALLIFFLGAKSFRRRFQFILAILEFPRGALASEPFP